MSAIDWSATFKQCESEVLNKPPYVNLKGVDKPPPRLANSLQELLYWRNRDPRLQKWLEYAADRPGYRKPYSDAWPDPLEEWDEEVDALVEGGTVPHPGAAMTWMYENNPEFKEQADFLMKEDDEAVDEWNKTRLRWVLNRAAWTVVWSARIARKRDESRKRARE